MLAFWPFDADDWMTAWAICVEASCVVPGRNSPTNFAIAVGNRVLELAALWQCDDDDAHNYAERLPVVLKMDGSAHCATFCDFENLVESPAGFGVSCLEAIADLAQNAGWRPRKLWGSAFQDVCVQHKVRHEAKP